MGKDMADFFLTKEELGRRLQECRESRGVTQQEMADYCNLSKNYISALERGLNKCNVQTLLGYCNILEISPNDLVGYPEQDILPEIKNIIASYDTKKQIGILKLLQIISKL